MKDPAVIEFCRSAVFNRLENSMETIDAVAGKRNQKAPEDAQTAKDERVRQRVQDYLSEAGDEFREALDQIGYEVANSGKEGLLAYALKTGDLLVIGSLVAKAIFADLIEQSEAEDE